MPSERTRYRRRWEDTPRTDIELTPLKQEIESVFSKRNLDEDCDTIAGLLHPYRKQIETLVANGQHTEAVTLFLEILESLTYHFVKDEHYNYFDDMYSPDYVCDDMLRCIMEAIDAGAFSEEALAQLKEGLKKVKETEAWDDYGTPYVVGMWEKYCKDNAR